MTVQGRVMSSDPEGLLIRFEVRDTGIGIPESRLPALFKPFSQVDASTTRRYGGTGLGLSIVKRLSQMMGGDAGVESREGVGSTFWFTARLAAATPNSSPVPARASDTAGDAAAPHIAQAPASVGRAPVAASRSPTAVNQLAPALQPSAAEPIANTARVYRILLAEDNPVNEMVAVRTLQKLGYEVDAVRDGRAAVTAWQTGRYDLILMDCQMPVLDGYGATRKIRSLEKSNMHIPIVALTAHAMRGDDLECKAAGMDEHLTKPLDRQILAQALQRFLEVGPPADAAAPVRHQTTSGAKS